MNRIHLQSTLLGVLAALSSSLVTANEGQGSICSAVLSNSESRVTEALQSGQAADQACTGEGKDEYGRPTTWTYSATYLAVTHPEVSENVVGLLIRGGASPVYSQNVLNVFQRHCTGGWGRKKCTDAWYPYQKGSTISAAITALRTQTVKQFVDKGYVLAGPNQPVDWRALLSGNGTDAAKLQMIDLYLSQAANPYSSATQETLLNDILRSKVAITTKRSVLQKWNFKDPRESRSPADYWWSETALKHSMSEEEALALLPDFSALGMDLNGRGGSFLRAAIANRQVRLAKELLARNVPVNTGERDSVIDGMGLHLATSLPDDNDALPLMRDLLDRGAPINGRCFHGATALQWAIALTEEPAAKARVELLLAHHADINMENDEGLTPLCRAKRQGHQSIVSLLKSNGAVLGNCSDS